MNFKRFMLTIETNFVEPSSGGQEVGIGLYCQTCNRILNAWMSLPVNMQEIRDYALRHLCPNEVAS